MPDISTRIVRPDSCTIGFGIPVSRVEYFRDLESGVHDYAAKVSTKVGDYEWAVLRYTNKILPAMRATGVNVRTGLTLADFASCFHDSTRPIIVLFSHWTGKDCIEFADGLTMADDAVAAIPRSFDGMLDLCVCHPSKLVVRLRPERPNIGLISWTDAEATPQLWLYFYLALFKSLQLRPKPYLAALDEQLAASFKAIERLSA